MRWEDERYVRVYTRDTAEWLALGWKAQALLVLLLRKADRAGIIQTGKAGVRGVAALAGMPLEVVQEALPVLLDDGCLRAMDGGGYVFPNFLAAQEARSSDAQRKREQRARDRDKAVAGGSSGSVTGLDAEAEMARQHPGWVYVVRSGARLKVGYTSNAVKDRMGNYRTHAPDTVLLTYGPGSRDDERALHAILGVSSRTGEWCTPTEEMVTHVVSCVTADGVRVTPLSHTGPDNVTVSVTPVTPSRTVPYRTELSASQALTAPPGDGVSSTPAFALEAQAPAAKRPREAPPGEVLYARLETIRGAECEAAGVPFVPSRWAYSRQNRDLGPIARLPDGHEEQVRFQAAWGAFLEDPQARELDEPFSLSFFWRMRSRYEGRGLKAVAS